MDYFHKISYGFALIIFLMMLKPHRSEAQPLKIDDPEVIQFSGLVFTTDSFIPVPYATIRVLGSNRGTITSESGFFTLPVYRTDTVKVTSVGYKPAKLYIPDTLEGQKFRLIVKLQADTLQLEEVVVYPWPDKQTFKYAFVHEDVPGDENIERMRKNLNRKVMLAINAGMEMDASENADLYMQQQAQRFGAMGGTNGFTPLNGRTGTPIPSSLLNPFSWYSFFESLKNGDFKRKQNETYDY